MDQDLVQVWQRQGEPDRLPLQLHNDDQPGINHRLQVLRHVVELFRGERHLAPVVLPAAGVQVMDDLHLVVEVPHVQSAEGEPLPLLHRVRYPLEAVADRCLMVHLVGKHVFDLAKTVCLEKPHVVARVIAHQDIRHPVEPVDQKTVFVVD